MCTSVLPGSVLGWGWGRETEQGVGIAGRGEAVEVNSSPPKHAASCGCSVHGKQLRGRRNGGK